MVTLCASSSVNTQCLLEDDVPFVLWKIDACQASLKKFLVHTLAILHALISQIALYCLLYAI